MRFVSLVPILACAACHSASPPSSPTETSAAASTASPSSSPEVQLGVVNVNGALTDADVQNTVARNLAPLQSCVAEAARQHEGIHGRIVVKLVLRPDQAPVSESGGSDVSLPSLVDCIVKSVGTFVYPKPDGKVTTAVVPILVGAP